MRKNYILVVLIVCFIELNFAQINILCSTQTDYIKIENTSDIPLVSDNGDGTVTLTHPDQSITDVFSDYVIYDFYQSYPNSNPTGELFKYYSIVHGNKDLITTIFNSLPSSTFSVNEYTFSPIDSDLVTLLDNKTYKLKSYCSDIPEVGETCETNQVIVSNDFELKIAFNYDSNFDIIRAETVNSSPCGNSFSIGMKGGYEDFSGTLDNKLQLWESDSGTSSESNYNEPCFYPEEMLYGLLDIGCFQGRNVGNLLVYEGPNAGQIILERENATFSTDFIMFEEDVLSVEENQFSQIKPYKIAASPFLQISNSENQTLSIEILSISGQIILKEQPFEQNKILLTNFANGLYFIKLKSLNNQQKVYKFLNN